MGGVYDSRAEISIKNDEGTEMKTVITTVTSVPSSQVPECVIQINNIASAQRRFLSPDLLQHNKEAREKYMSTCVPLYKAAIRGDWEAAERIIKKDKAILTTGISVGCLGVLHLAAGTKNVHFVEQLVGMMGTEDLELRDEKGNTALSFAAAAGDVHVARILLGKNHNLATMRGGQDMTPLYMAALFGHSDMAWYLYDKTKEIFNDRDQVGIFFSCINTGIYDLALEMLKVNLSLATARDMNNKTALHLLAQNPAAFAHRSSEGWSKLVESCLKFKFKRNSKRTQALELVKCLWDQVLTLGHEEAMNIISTPSKLLFDATKGGNFEFLSELINSYPDLVWEHDDQNRSIIHIAVMYRHANIFNILHDIGPIKNVITTYEDAEGNNLLHLAAKRPPLDRLNTVSGAALQMQQELLWFEVVKNIVQPVYVKKENKSRKIPEQLFSNEHKRLLREGEQWMKNTANSCMIVSTLITTVVFAAVFTLPGSSTGSDNNTGSNNSAGSPNEHQGSLFFIFILSDGLALFSSIVAILMFLSILTSRYAEYDFRKSLPLKLMIGLASLFFSMITMVIAFSSTFAIACQHGLKWVPFLISIIALVPVALFVVLKYSLFFDTFRSTYWSRTVFQPTRRMLY